MTQSTQSQTASGTDIKASSRLAEFVQKSKVAPGPKKLSESIPASLRKPLAFSEATIRRAKENDRQIKDDQERQAEYRRRAAQAERAIAFLKCGIEQRHLIEIDSDVSNEWSDKLAIIKPRLGTGFMVALVGDRGTGKTQMAVELIRYHIHNTYLGWSASYIRVADILMSIKECYRKDGPSEKHQLEKYLLPQLLVIDEAHERGDTDWESRMLNYLLDRRYGDMKDTLLISNQKPEAFKDSVGPSIYSRLIETGGIIECNWASFRKAK